MREIIYKCDVCGATMTPQNKTDTVVPNRIYSIMGEVNGHAIVDPKTGENVGNHHDVEFCTPACLRKYVNEVFDRAEGGPASPKKTKK